MPLPDFTANGLLPPGIHKASEHDLRERCVTSFPGSATREVVFGGFLRYRVLIKNSGLSATQWVDGSFGDQTRTDPEDIDLVNFVKQSELVALDPKAKPVLRAILDGRENTKRDYCCHTFLVISFPVGHPMQDTFEHSKTYWRTWFSNARDYSNPRQKVDAPQRGIKGIIEMTVGDSAAAPKVTP